MNQIGKTKMSGKVSGFSLEFLKEKSPQDQIKLVFLAVNNIFNLSEDEKKYQCLAQIKNPLKFRRGDNFTSLCGLLTSTDKPLDLLGLQAQILRLFYADNHRYFGKTGGFRADSFKTLLGSAMGVRYYVSDLELKAAELKRAEAIANHLQALGLAARAATGGGIKSIVVESVRETTVFRPLIYTSINFSSVSEKTRLLPEDRSIQMKTYS